MELYNGDCLEVLKDLSDNSIDIIIADPPFQRFLHLSWDRKIDFEPLWEQLWRVSKPNTPIFLFGDFKFALEIYNSQPKYFKYEIVWNKGTTTTPLLSRKRFGKCTEYILVFYKKQPVYNYAKYHKIIKKVKNSKRTNKAVANWEGAKNYKIKNNYSPKLPTNIIEEEIIDKYKHLNHRGNKLSGKHNTYEPKLPLNIIDCSNEIITNYDPNHKKKEKNNMSDAWNGTIFKSFKNKYDPKLPLNIIENEEPKDYGGIKNVKYYKKGKKWNPKLPLNIIDCSNEIISNETIGTDWCGGKCKRSLDVYEPRLPCNVIKCQTKRNKKIIKKLTEKPQFILEHLLKYFSNEGDTCLDFCMGSGSMGVACNTLNRKFIGIEKNKEFFEITKKRLTSPNII